jgi:hypothetical protein
MSNNLSYVCYDVSLSFCILRIRKALLFLFQRMEFPYFFTRNLSLSRSSVTFLFTFHSTHFPIILIEPSMKMGLVRLPKNPLDLPEIRTLVASFLDRKDCFSCMRVSQDWFKDFVGPVWYSIDMAKDDKFVTLSPQVLAKYGHCIRQVLNILTFDHVKALTHPKLDSVTSMSVVNHGNPYHRAIEFDFIRRNNASLTELDFQAWRPHHDTPHELQNRNENYLEPSILAKSESRLTNLSLGCVYFTHEGFTTILRNSPALRKLKLSRVIVVHYNSAFELFKGSSVTSLHASLAEICMPDPGLGWTPSLLHLFPRLEEWHLPCVDRSSNWGDDIAFRRELRDCCPRLKTLRFDPVDDTDKLSDLLFNSFRQPESCTFSAKNLSQGMILSLFSHLNTLTTIKITDKYTDDETLRWLYLIPKSCSHLEVLSMQDLVLDMESVEEHEWICKHLRELRVRFKGLEDIQLIDECLRKVCLQRQHPSPFSALHSTPLQVSRHLLQFEKLTTVSLGTKLYRLPHSAT